MRPRRHPTRSRFGGALVELAVVFPVLLMLILGMVEMGRLGMVSQIVTNAARDGCRLAVLNGKTQTDADNRIKTLLNGGGITTYTVTYSPTGFASVKAVDSSNLISVTVSVEYKNVSWLPKPWFLKNAKVTGYATMCSERQ